MDLTYLLALVGIGISTGFLSGMFGIGGGSVRIPLLALAGMPLINAFATNMFTIPFSSAVGAYVQRKNIAWKAAKPFVVGAVLAIVAATILVGFVSEAILALLFFLAALVTVGGLYLDRISPFLQKAIRSTRINLFLGGFFANFVIGMRGGSGGTLFPPILSIMDFKMHEAIATSLFVGLLTSLAALSIYSVRGDVLLAPAVFVASGNVLGSYFGSRASLKANTGWLKAGLATIVFVLACVVLFREFL